MKVFFKFVIGVFIISTAFILASCTKSNYPHSFHKKSSRSTSSALAVESKNKPPTKNFIIPQKKKKILGQKTPKIK